jgi:hypothetical protein
MRSLSKQECETVNGGVDIGCVLTSVAVCSVLYFYRDAIKVMANSLFKQATKATDPTE